ncbi:hypothetical protein IWQ60_005694 [Tieghemiomyces parasiticus]|uniref:Sphingomyelin synthase-like domain-containing protein n=1 Tax=Tieghemiomyces parasiticus TaxID=78921 RepID=A0A9W8ABV3_9FUNG|nr:hypothetical protein IWQ60_005694 [Tieghemiomyces parasiticus]
MAPRFDAAQVRELPRRLWHHILEAPKQVNHWEILRTFLAVVYLVVVAFFMVFMQMVSDRRWNQSDPQLRDLAFDWFPYVNKVSVADDLVSSSLIIVLAGNLLLTTNWRNRIIFVRRCLWLIGTLYFFRGFTLVVTTVPSPRLDCVPTETHGAADMFRVGWDMITTKTKACTDNIYSGHTVILCASFFLWRVHSRYAVIIIYSALHSIAGMIMVLYTHLHYFVDILIAVFFTYSMFSLYFYALDLAVHDHFNLTPYRVRCRCELRPSLGRRLINAYRFNSAPEGRADSIYAQDAFAMGSGVSPSQITVAPATAVDPADYKALAFTPRILNNGVPRFIAWLDGLDLRVPPRATGGSNNLPGPGGACPIHWHKTEAPYEMAQHPMV